MAAQVMKTIGVIGLGSIGMRHAKNLLALGHTVYGWDTQTGPLAELVAVGGLNGDGEPPYSGLDGVVIASPTRNHIEHMVWGRNHAAFVEKPISNVMFKPSENILMVGYNQRFNSAVKQAKQWLDGGEIGTPLWGHFRCSQFNDKPDYLRDGVILNWSHEIDLALYLLGPAQVARQFTRVTNGKDDMTDIILLHENRISSTIHLDYLTRPERRGFEIGGTNGVIHVLLVDRTARLLDPEDEMRKYFHDDKDGYAQDYIDEMKAFIDRIDGKDTIGCTGAEALQVLEICLEVRKQAGLT